MELHLEARLREYVGRAMHEWRYGIRTSGRQSSDELGLDDALNGYEPAEWRVLPAALKRTGVGPEDVFMDIGSGKGRVVIQAATYPFKRVIGLEYAAALSAAAEENVAHARVPRRAGAVELVTADALTYDYPPDLSVVFFNNSFGGELFGSLLDRLIASVDAHGKPMRFIYRNPLEHEMVVATGRFEMTRGIRWRDRHGEQQGASVHLYALQPLTSRGQRP
jgi:SAM-dependent methyltransferase